MEQIDKYIKKQKQEEQEIKTMLKIQTIITIVVIAIILIIIFKILAQGFEIINLQKENENLTNLTKIYQKENDRLNRQIEYYKSVIMDLEENLRKGESENV